MAPVASAVVTTPAPVPRNSKKRKMQPTSADTTAAPGVSNSKKQRRDDEMRFLGWKENARVGKVLKEGDVIVIPTDADASDAFAIAVTAPDIIGGTRFYWIGMVDSITQRSQRPAWASVKYLTKDTDISKACFRGVKVPEGEDGLYMIENDTVILIIRNAPKDRPFDILAPLLEELQSKANTGKGMNILYAAAAPVAVAVAVCSIN